jgi:hypothetical protein
VPAGGVFSASAVVRLAATADTHYGFAGWSGDAQGTANPLEVVVDTDRAVTASFQALRTTNGVPHWWLDTHGLATDDAAALADRDLDGAAAWEEFIADTHPGLASSVFSIEALQRSRETQVHFHGSTQRVYRLEYAEPTDTETWHAVPGQTDVPGSGPGTVLRDADDGGGRRYRVRVGLP